MKLSILIVSYNVRDLLERCLHSLERIPGDWEVIVVDNDSKDGTKEMLNASRVTRHASQDIFLSKNIGFARGNTEAYKYATGEYILLLNPDTKVLPNAIEKMVEYLDANPDVWVVGPKLLNEDGSVQRSVRGFPTLSSQIFVLLKLHNLTPPFVRGGQRGGLTSRLILNFLNNYYFPHFDYSKTQDVDQVMGAALMTRRSVIEKVGFLDPRFKRWFEEVDFCYRAKHAGGKVVYLSESRIVHSKGASFDGAVGAGFTSARPGQTRRLMSLPKMIIKQYYFNQGMARFFWKHKPLWQSALLFPFLVASLLGTAVLWLMLKLKTPLVKNKEM